MPASVAAVPGRVAQHREEVVRRHDPPAAALAPNSPTERAITPDEMPNHGVDRMRIGCHDVPRVAVFCAPRQENR
jgi:hypothetical protein